MVISFNISRSTIGTSTPIDTSHFLTAAGVAGGAAISSNKHWRLSVVTVREGECITSCTTITPGATLFTTGDWTEKHFQPIGTKKYDQGNAKQILIGGEQ